MQINPYLNFNGRCEEAFRFYEKLLAGKIVFMMTWGESPEATKMPAELSKQIMHATLKFGDNILMGADCPPDYYLKPAGITVSIGLKDATEGERIFNALAEGGTVKMPFQKTFWSPGFGMCIDRFDIPWMVNCDVNA